MIDYDYKLTRIGDNGQPRVFLPTFDKSIPNISMLSCINSSGKSTLMNLIALAFYGEDNKSVSDQLRMKLVDLKEGEDSEYKFEIIIKTDQVQLKAEMSKSGYIEGQKQFDRRVFISKDTGFQLISKEKFKQSFHLIYDIPEKPLDRINDLTVEARNTSSSLQISLNRLHSEFIKVNKEVESAFDSGLLLRVKNSIENKEGQLSEQEQCLADIEKEIESTEHYYYALVLSQSKEQYDQQNKQLKKETSKQKRTKTSHNASVKQYQQYRSTAIHYVELISSLRSYVCSHEYAISEVNPAHIEQFKKAIPVKNAEEIVDKNCYNFTDLRVACSNLRLDINNHYKNHESKQLASQRDLYGNLLRVLDNLGAKERKDLVVNKDSVDDFYQTIKNEYDQIDSQLNQHDTVKIILDKLTEIISNGDQLKKVMDSIEVPEDISIDDSETHIQELQERVEKAKSQYAADLKNAHQHNIDETQLESILDSVPDAVCNEGQFDCKSILTLISSLKSRQLNLNKKINGLTHDVENLRSQKESIENRPKHELSAYSKELSELGPLLRQLSKSLNEKIGLLDKIVKKEKVQPEANTANFLEQIWTYLGHRMNIVRYIGNEYKVDKIDMINQIIISGNTTIKFSQMGTGDSQLAYMKTILNLNESKPIIALFDEIEHMDKRAIDSIVSQLNDLKKSGKLLIGIMAKPGEHPEVISYDLL